jgi:arylsulfatase A-like enzyme
MYMLGPIPTEDPPPVVRGASQGSGPTVNVLFLMWDTARADRMSLYGHTRNTTPYLEGFASESLVFEGAYAPSFWTVPSHASLFTGAPVSDHRTNAHQTWLPNEYVTLAEHLGSHGYETWMFTANPNLSPRTNLIQGFETVHSPRQVRWESQAIALTQAKLIASDMSTERSPSWPGKKNRASKEVGPLMGDALLDWLDARDSQRPFFAFINYMEVHGPRLPSMESRQALLDPETLALGLETSAGFRNISDANHTRQHYTTAQKEAMLGVYDAAILDLDRLTGDLLEALRERGVLDNTLIVLTSDHGDAFGEHDLFGHNYSLYNELIHVPLLLRLPQGAHAARVDHPVSNRAIFSTLTQLLNLPGPPIPSPLPSLLAAPNHPVVYAEFTASHGSKRGLPLTREDGSVIELRRRYLAQMTPAWKFIRSSDGNHELYDRTQDVGDQRNLAESEPERLKSLLEQAEIWREEHTRSTGKRLSSKERAMKKRAGADVPLEALEALGYME